MSEQYKIDKTIPLPRAWGRGQDVSEFGAALSRLEVGDSVFAAGKTHQTVSGFFIQRRPKKFAARTVTENGVKGLRIWRVK